jgi:hypothetical protein
MFPNQLEIQEIVTQLKGLPLFNFSLSSKELFHSNFLAWICEMYPQILGNIFGDFLKNNEAILTKVYREHKNIDLTLEYSNGETLIIENKVKSLPDLEQLRKYSDKYPDANFLLLSLVKPNFSCFLKSENKILINHEHHQFIWHYLNYDDLAQKLEELQLEISENNLYHGQLLAEYIQFIKHLHKLSSLFYINDNDNSIFYNKNIYPLMEIRFHDVIIKLRYSQLAELIKQRLTIEGFKINNWHDFKQGDFIVKSDMVKNKGVCDFYYCIEKQNTCLNNGEAIGNNIFVGIQIDDLKFNVSWLFWPDKPRGNGKIIAERLLNSNIWFDLSFIPGNSKEYPTGRNKVFNQYNQGTMLYRYKNLEKTITINEIIELILKYLYIIKEKELAIERIIDNVLNIS